MLKSKPNFFTKTIQKSHINQPLSQLQDKCTTRRKYFKHDNKQNNLTSIIKNLQQNVKDLKIYHESLTKRCSSKFHKSTSLNHINKINENFNRKIKSKDNLIRNYKRELTRKNSYSGSNKLNNKYQNIGISKAKQEGILSNISKYPHQNASTMVSFNNGDVQEVKKAYQQTYGKQNSNIVDLYYFFKKNIQKSTRILGSMQMSSYPQNQNSEQFHTSKEQQKKKESQLLNVIIQDRNQKQNNFDASNHIEKNFSHYKKPAVKKPSIQQIFKNGSSDLANVCDFVKKRRVSLINYVRLEKNMENNLYSKNKISGKNKQERQLEQSLDISKQPPHKGLLKSIEPQKEKDTAYIHVNTFDNKFQQFQTYKKQFVQKSSKKSQKSSSNKSKRTEAKQLNNQKIPQIDSSLNNEKANEKSFHIQKVINQKLELPLNKNTFNEAQQYEQKYQRFKKSKYYVQPIPIPKKKKEQNSLDGCSISVKSSSRIIELDFIPLDL